MSSTTDSANARLQILNLVFKLGLTVGCRQTHYEPLLNATTVVISHSL